MTVANGDHIDYAAGYEPASVVIGDLDDDNDLDLVAANPEDNSVSILLGSGDGTFTRTEDYVVGQAPKSLALEDLDGSGSLDLIVAHSQEDNISVLLGNGDGSFADSPDRIDPPSG